MVAEYSLKSANCPIGISEYKLARKLPGKLQEALPSVELLEGHLTNGDRNIEEV